MNVFSKPFAAITITFALSGCSTLRTLEPNAIPIELNHVSHMTQHEPFNAHPTNYGYDALSIGAKWRPLKNLSISISEGVVLERQAPDGEREYGALYGPREVFNGRIAYEIPLK